MDKKNLIQARTDYIDLIKKELLGPGSEISIPDIEHELISDAPVQRYCMGILFPKDTTMQVENNDTEELSTEKAIEEDEENSDYEAYASNSNMAEDSEKYIKKNSLKSEFEDDNADDTNNANEEINLAAQNKPSSFGISFMVESEEELNEIKCKIDFATYRKARLEDCRFPIDMSKNPTLSVHPSFSSYMYYYDDECSLKLRLQSKRKEIRELLERTRSSMSDNEYQIGNKLYQLNEQLKHGYVREPHSENISVEFLGKDYTASKVEVKDCKNAELKISAIKRRIVGNKYSVTVMILNDSNAKTEISLHSIFQPVLSINSDENNFTFCPYTDNVDFEQLSTEEQAVELQYRNKQSYGTGLGVSINWDEINEHGRGTIKSEYFPQHEVPSVDFILPEKYKVNEKAFSMKFLSDLDESDKSEKIRLLSQIVNAYESWINELSEKSKTLESKYSDIAKHNINGCVSACNRMKKGLEILTNNDNAWTSFTLANRAMYMQRVHLKIQTIPNPPYYPDNKKIKEILDSLDYYTADDFIDDRFSWRPFQIGFLLMSIEGIVCDKSDDRELIDLIWFPTGGGKTEAYLGLTAFTIFFRRLQYPDESGGTTVIMRYTLRLLTAQQFTRASTLICACEYIREGHNKNYPVYNLGEEEISIGLWIGSAHTPNSNKTAAENLEKLKKGNSQLQSRLDYYNKFQVLKCPWCGTSLIKGQSGTKEIGDWGYAMHKKSFELRCTNENCFFDEIGKLPIQIVDDELYKTPPTLLFATVDKFAMLTWREETGSFFAQSSKNRTPELIIQDELHLISGPLGTMVGLYESAIDYLCRQKGSCTKIIASTATIKKAKEQCSALYNRDVAQFPHPGLDYDDSFFSKETVIDYNKGVYGRKYVGILPAGKTKVMTEVRTIASLMQKISTMDVSDEIKDKFWSLVLYFNSIKDLGKCSTILEDDVKDAMRRASKRKDEKVRKVWRFDELTSRVSTSNLNSTMDTLEKIKYSSEENTKSIDAVLATNMISVGIDISRLNAMLIVGQPKLTSEYIQASSRIGREYPGVAFLLYDATKSRDRSHYEQFKSYHQTFYKFVEPTIATPFSKPARERALHAVIIAMMRHKFNELSSEEAAAAFKRENYKEAVDEIKEFILERQQQINMVMNPDAEDDSFAIEKEIDDIFEKWESLAAAEWHDSDKFVYGKKYMVQKPDEEKREGRLLKLYNTANSDSAIDTMTSMRSVDVEVKGKLLIWEERK